MVLSYMKKLDNFSNCLAVLRKADFEFANENEIYRTGSGTLRCGRLSFLQKCLGTASYDSGVSILSEMAAKPYDQGKKKEAELPV